MMEALESQPSPPQAQLKSDVIGLLGAATLGMVFLSPAMTLYGLFGPIYLAVGKFAPLAFVLGLLATLPTAFSYAVLSRDFPSSGSTADWSARAIGARMGAWAGYLVLLYYLTNFVIQIVAVGVFFNALLLALGLVLPDGMGFIVGVLFGSALPAWMVYRGLSISARGALLFLLVEIGVVTALCVTIVAVAPSRGQPVAFDGFNVATALTNPSAMFGALVFAMLGFCGFDVVSTLAEETKAPRKLIPQATVLALLLYAVLIIAGMWALTQGADARRLKAIADLGQMPINEVAASVWGNGSLAVTITALTATLGLIVATAVGTSRVLFAMGRSAAAPRVFSRLHGKYSTPWAALHVIFALGLLGTFAVAYLLSNSYDAYVWWCTTSTFFAMLTFLFGNLAAVLLNRARIRGSVGGALLYGLVPTVGIVADLYIVVQSFFIEQWALPWRTGKSVVVFDVACAAIALVVVMIRRPGRASGGVAAVTTDAPAIGLGGVA